MAKKKYDGSSIKVLKGLEAVKKRPAMYIGSTGQDGVNHLVYEAVDNSIDEAVAGHGKKISVKINEDNSIEVRDYGRGIPPEKHKTEKISCIELVFTTLHAGGKFDHQAYKVSGGLHGVGISVVNALSEDLEVISYRGKKSYSQSYQKGIPKAKIKSKGTKEKSGTFVRFKPDPDIFGNHTVCSDTIARRLKELSYLNPGVTLELTDERTGENLKFFQKKGLLEYIDYLMGNKKQLCEPFLIKSSSSESDKIKCEFEMAFCYEEGWNTVTTSFCNNINTYEGGVHLNASLDSLAKVITNIAESSKLLEGMTTRPTKGDISEGLYLAVSIKISNPEFEGQTKTRLGNQDIRSSLGEFIKNKLTDLFKKKKQIGKMIAEKVANALRSREEVKKSKDVLGKSKGFSLSGKLADCSSNKPEECELFLVEGDSAGGSAKQARDRMYQAVLPLKGKVLNAQKTTLSRLLDNQEIKSIIAALRIYPSRGKGSKMDLTDLRYHKVVILTDADVDGSHISCLLLTLFYKYMRDLINNGHVYVADPPLYKVVVKNKSYYIQNDDGLSEFKKKHKSNKIQVSRFKGLGEMNPSQLTETVLDTTTRKLRKIMIEDAIEAEKIIDNLMGKDADARKDFLASRMVID